MGKRRLPLFYLQELKWVLIQLVALLNKIGGSQGTMY